MEVKEIPGRGRGVVALRDFQAGEVLLRESPLLVYAEAEAAASGLFCAHCSRCISPSSSSACICERCNRARFCAAGCRVAAERSSHGPWVCSALSGLLQLGLDHEVETQGRFLIAAVELAMRNPDGFQQLLLLDGQPSAADDPAGVATIVEGMLRNAFQGKPAVSVEMMVALLSKDKRNTFGLMAPPSGDGQRKVRAYALYAKASMFNHDCLPNACRFEYLDKAGKSNTDIYIRLLHDVARGTEVCLSYFPVNWTYFERQKRLREDYGFECRCDRCKVEETWSDEEAMEQDEGAEEESDDQQDEQEQIESDGKDDFPHAMFFVKYLCPTEACGGTMAPLPDNPSAMECNVCGRLRTEEEFLRDLEQNGMAS